jgi:predicted GNAT family N-acyltransferase
MVRPDHDQKTSMSGPTIVPAATPAARERAFAIRRRVSVDEQGVPARLEFDELDREVLHLLAILDGEAVGTLRLRSPGDGLVKIERVAVLAQARGRGIGEALITEALRLALQAGAGEVILHAQVRIRSFYEKLGFQASGAAFIEDGIRHIAMRLGPAGASDAA